MNLLMRSTSTLTETFMIGCKKMIFALSLLILSVPIKAEASFINFSTSIADGFQNFHESLEEIDILSTEEMELIAQIAWNEAGNQSVLGKRLVIDTILNRKDHEAFPDTIESVIFQPNQYTTIQSGVKEDMLRLVEREVRHRINTKVIFFRTNKYSNYGVPLFKEGAHFFSGYE